jgi:hypothetical protein
MHHGGESLISRNALQRAISIEIPDAAFNITVGLTVVALIMKEKCSKHDAQHTKVALWHGSSSHLKELGCSVFQYLSESLY